MDLSLLPTSASEYNNQRTGARFTVRSANSPSYSLTRRPGVRKAKSVLEEEKESREEVRESQKHGTHTSTNGTNKEEDHTVSGCLARIGSRSSVKGQCEEKETSGHKTSTGLNQQGTAEKIITDFGTDRSGNSSEIRGRTDFRRYNLPSRSKSVDWRTGERSPDWSKKDERFMLSTKREGEVNKQAGDLDERISGSQGLRGRVMSSVHVYNSAGINNDVGQGSLVTNMSQTLDRTSRGQSLPSRFRSQSGIVSGVGETSGGQTILERIEKLFGSVGFGNTDNSSKTRDFLTPGTTTSFHVQQRISGGTFPRHFSSGQKNRLSPVQSTKSFTWTQKDTSDSASHLPSGTSRTWGQWQEQPKDSSYPEERGVHWGRGSEDTGTRSLDRARSRYTLAAQIRSARAAEGITEPIQSNKILGEEKLYASKDFSVLKESRANEDRARVNHRQEEGRQEKEKNTEVETKQKSDLKSSSADDVFESNPQKTTMKTIGKKNFPEMLPVPSAASVKNKISQFEALTQRSLGLARGQVLMPRRAFSVPTQLSKAHDGVKKSGSAKAIGELRDKSEGLKKGEEAGEKTAENVTRIGNQLETGRSLSVDEVGLRLRSKEKERNDLAENEKKDFDSGNNSAEGSDNYSRLKSSLKIPLNGGAQRRRRFFVDETDSPEESSSRVEFKRPSSLLHNPSDTFTGVQRTTPSPVSDDDKTPTNTPDDSPFLSAAAQPDDATPTADRETESTPALTHAARASKPDSPPLSRPSATSSPSNLSELISTNVSAALPNGKKKVLDLDAWVAGVNTEIKPWTEDEDDNEDYDDDDDDDDDDESTQKDEDSNYDSDSGESSVTITSNMSQSDRRSFCVSLSDLCNFAGVDYESENDSDEWQPTGRRSASLSSDMSALSYVSVMPSEELDKLLEDVRSLGENNLQDYNDVKVVVLHKEVGTGLGFTVAGGADQNKPVTVHKVFKSGVAAQEGSIMEGDQVLSINGTSLCGFVHWEALRVLRRAKTRDLGVVVLRREGTSSACIGGANANNPGPTQTQLTETGQHVCVRLEKNSRDLGFSLKGGVGSNQDNKPLTVQKIFQGGPVDKVYPGDEVLEIDGMSMVGMRRLEVWTWIRRLPPGPVDVVLRRPL